MARTPIDTGVKITQAIVSAGADAAHYHYTIIGLERDVFAERPLFAEVEVALGDTAEAQENAIIDAINTVAEEA